MPSIKQFSSLSIQQQHRISLSDNRCFLLVKEMGAKKGNQLTKLTLEFSQGN